METFNGVTKLGFLLLAFRVLSKEFYFKKTEMKIRVRVTPSACCLLPGDGRQIASGEHPAVLPSTACEVREGGSTSWLLSGKVCKEAQVALLLAGALWCSGRGCVWCPRSRPSPGRHRPASLGPADWLPVCLKLFCLSPFPCP